MPTFKHSLARLQKHLKGLHVAAKPAFRARPMTASPAALAAAGAMAAPEASDAATPPAAQGLSGSQWKQ